MGFKLGMRRTSLFRLCVCVCVCSLKEGCGGDNSLKWFDVVSFFFFLEIYLFLFIYFWLCWVFVSVRGLSLVAASEGHSSSRCAGLSLSWPLLLRSTGSRRADSVVVAHGPSCPATCGIFPDQGSNPCSLHWQADSQLLRHQGSPSFVFLTLDLSLNSVRGIHLSIYYESRQENMR